MWSPRLFPFIEEQVNVVEILMLSYPIQQHHCAGEALLSVKN
jgi:hypothetical protein